MVFIQCLEINVLEHVMAWFSEPNAPAWIQAIGSIVAIFAAVITSAIQHDHAIDVMKKEDSRRAQEREEIRKGVAGALLCEMTAAANRLMAFYDTLIEVSQANKKGMSVASFRAWYMPERKILSSLGPYLTTIPGGLLQQAILFDAAFQNFNLSMTEIANDSGGHMHAELCVNVANKIRMMVGALSNSITIISEEVPEDQYGTAEYIVDRLKNLI